MKKFIFLFLLTISLNLQSQVGITVDPMYGIPGVIIAHPDYYGYVRAKAGIVKDAGVSFNYYKFAIGYNIHFKEFNVVMGVNKNIFTHVDNNNLFFDEKELHPYSVELGFIDQFPNKENIYIVGITDILNWGTDLGVIIKF
jgi:hypothetical protein